ncbi:hypothetical protein G6F37_009267 [Rhizopus arrhizus]|nr:hypothetical protein G6F37_009267 [Rhizopus arrhizus]
MAQPVSIPRIRLILKQPPTDSLSNYENKIESIESQDVQTEHTALPVMLNEGDDDKDDRSSIEEEKEMRHKGRPRGRPRKKSRGEKSEHATRVATVHNLKKKRGRPRKDESTNPKLGSPASKRAKSDKSIANMHGATKKQGFFNKKNEVNSTGRVTQKYIERRDRQRKLPYSSSESSNEDDSGAESGTESHSDSESEISSESSSETDSNFDSGSEVASFESETETETSEGSYKSCKKSSKRSRRENIIDKNFTNVSLQNIIRRRDKYGNSSEAPKSKRVITRSNRRLNYRESSDEETPYDSDSSGGYENNFPWCCDFEPHRPGQVQTDVAALAGSHTVLFLDVRQGRYTKKYIHSEKQEIFHCIAWTTLIVDEESDSSSDDDEETCNVLAVAGRLGSIKLLNPLQNECYRYLFGHRDTILRMVFSEFEPRWLFSASADKTVRLWDIGSPTSATDDSICLAKFVLPSYAKEPSALNVSYDLSTVLVGCSDVEQNKDENAAIIQPTSIYPAGDEWHEGCVDDMHIIGQDSNERSPLYNHVVSRGAADMEIVVWNLANSTPEDIDIYKSLDWPESDGCTGLRFKVIEKNGQKVLIAGDYKGKIRIFNIDDGIMSKTLPDNSKEVTEPIKILSHTISNRLIRDVSCSADTRSIIAVDIDSNTFVWRCTDTN